MLRWLPVCHLSAESPSDSTRLTTGRNTQVHCEDWWLSCPQPHATICVMCVQIARKLAAARAALAAADGAHGSALASIQEKEKQKRWTKF